MQYKLRAKGSSETVDAVVTSGDRQAKQYVQLKKRLPLEIFEKLYEVITDDRDRPTRI